MKKKIIFLLFLLIGLTSAAHTSDTLSTARDTTRVPPRRHSFIKIASKVIDNLFNVDTAYIEPQHYKLQAMVQNRYSYEVYRVSDGRGNSVRFEPKPSMKIGPYIGWSLIFLGWSVDVLHMNDGNKRKEFDISLYSLPIGVDLFWRKSGDDYTIKNVSIAGVDNTSALENLPFDGLQSSVTGMNLYYIFNHRRFSYPAAFNQSTQQKISCGSPLVGIGYTQHTLQIDWKKLNTITRETLGPDVIPPFVNTTETENITYTALSLSGGYGYNWVFAKNWLFASSLSLAISYKHTISNSTHGSNIFGESISFRDFKLSNLTLDGVGRFGLVWNNSRWFVGASAIVHSYNYSKKEFMVNNVFGMINIYGGFNFLVKKKYRTSSQRRQRR